MTTPSFLNVSINDLAQIKKGQKFYAIESENIGEIQLSEPS